MPYIITTYAPGGSLQPAESGQEPDSRRAVATLDDARDVVIAQARNIVAGPFSPLKYAGQAKLLEIVARKAGRLTPTGGTISLTGGTVIEVRVVPMGELAEMAGLASAPAIARTHDVIIDTYNAAQEATS